LASTSGSSAIEFPLSQTLEDAAHIVCPACSVLYGDDQLPLAL